MKNALRSSAVAVVLCALLAAPAVSSAQTTGGAGGISACTFSNSANPSVRELQNCVTALTQILIVLIQQVATMHNQPVSPYLNQPTYVPPEQTAVSSINVLSPNGGETWTIGSIQTIRWTSSNFPADRKIDVIRLRGSSGETNLLYGTVNDGSEQIVVPLVSPGSYVLEIKTYSTGGQLIFDSSDAPFNIITASTSPTPTITVTPSVLHAGDIATIAWNTAYTGASSFYYEGTSGQLSTFIRSVTGTSGNFNWIVPAGITGNWRIRGGNNYDGNFYSAPFTISAAQTPIQTPAGAPSVYLYASSGGRTAVSYGSGVGGTLTVNVGDSIFYNWSATNADSADSSYSIMQGGADNCTDANGSMHTGTGPFPWEAHTTYGSIATSGIVKPCQAGHTYAISYSAANSQIRGVLSPTAVITVVVNPSAESGAASPVISVSPSSFSFTATQGAANPSGQTLTFTNSGRVNANWSVSGPNWLLFQDAWQNTVAAGSFVPGSSINLSVLVNASGLTAGTYSGTITVSGNFSGSSMSIPVALTVAAPVSSIPPTPTQASLSLSASNLGFQMQAGGSAPSSQGVSFTASGASSVAYVVQGSPSWLTVSPSSGTAYNFTATYLTVSAAPQAAGTYAGTITISPQTGSGAAFTPQTITVTFTVAAAVQAPASPPQFSSNASSYLVGAAPTYTISNLLANQTVSLTFWSFGPNGRGCTSGCTSAYTTNASGVATTVGNGFVSADVGSWSSYVVYNGTQSNQIYYSVSAPIAWATASASALAFCKREA